MTLKMIERNSALRPQHGRLMPFDGPHCDTMFTASTLVHSCKDLFRLLGYDTDAQVRSCSGAVTSLYICVVDRYGR